MKIVDRIRDERPSTNVNFNDFANRLWKDKIPFNIFTSEGYLSDDAKQFILSNRDEVEKFKNDNNTWGDAILNYAEYRELGYQCQKGARPRSSVKFSGDIILRAHMEHTDRGDVYDPTKDVFQQNSSAIDRYELQDEVIESYR